MEPKPPKKPPSRRRHARILAIQALYAWDLTANPIAQVLEDMLVEREVSDPFDLDFYKQLTLGTASHLGVVDQAFAPYLDRTVAALTPIERAILRLGVYELQSQLDIPYRIIINESIELAKQFGAQSSHKYINGVLDKASMALRAGERS